MTTDGHTDGPQNAALAAVMENFPEAVARIRQLFQQSPYFWSLCEDYWECRTYCQYWRQDDSEQASAYGKIYRELLGEREQEVRQYLKQNEV